MFTTLSGQTGLDAYIFEATAIANAQRELDRRFSRLVQTVRNENPQLFANRSDYAFEPNAIHAGRFALYVQGDR